MAMDYLVGHRPRFLWIALGDTDEWAHRNDYRGYLEALRFADDVVGELTAHLAEMGEYGAHTTLLVTTDHGRDGNFADHGSPTSAGVWLMARGGPVAVRGALSLSRVRHLRDIAPTISTLLGEPSPRGAERGEVLDELL
jgi:phosphopentomutase